MDNNRDSRVKDERESATLIGAGVVISGNVESSVDLQIEGQVDGDVRGGTVIVAEDGVVNGCIHADRVRILGSVEGTVDTTDVAVEGPARVRGDVIYTRLKVTAGAIIEGNLKHRAEEAGASETANLTLVEAARSAKPRAVYGELD